MSTLKKAAVLGWPIGQSLSPLIHNHWMAIHGIDASYEAIAVEPDNLADLITGLPDKGFVGCNVTVPHKETVMAALDKVAPMALSIGAVNTVVIKDGVKTGFNTDIGGFKKQLDDSASNWPTYKPPLIIGAGGAARAAVAAFLSTEVPFIMITNRTQAKAEKIATEIGRGRVAVVEWENRHTAVAGAGVIANTTTLGMTDQPALDLKLDLAASDTVVYDIVFKPLETALLKAANAKGLKTVDGLGMLVYQAAAAFKLWFGVDPVYDDALKAKLMEQLT